MTLRSIRWTRRAVRRLDQIGSFISRSNPAAADRVVTRIVSAANALTEMPERGRPGRVKGTRELVLAEFPYIIPYRIHEQAIEILSVLHASQAWPSRF